MIELKNSKTQYLGKVSGRERYALDAFIGAVQMREAGGEWQDIKPQLVRDADGWHIEGAPYYAEVKDDGSRLFCPDRNERSRYLRIPAPDLLRGLSKNVVQRRAKLDGELLGDRISMPAEWGEIRVGYGNTGMKFEVLFTQAPPPGLFGRESPRILLDVETAGLDIEQLLSAKTGIGIPPPRLTSDIFDADRSRQVKRLNWSYKNGQLELGFDLGDLPFPILLKNTTVDIDVGAMADDCRVFWNGSNWVLGELWFIYFFAGYQDSGSIKNGGGMRFQNIAVPQGATIDTATVIFVCALSNSYTTANTRFTGEDADDAAAFSDLADYQARRGTVVGGANNNNITSAQVDWDNIATWVAGTSYPSPELKSIVQEIVNRTGWASGNDMVIFWDDHDGRSTETNYSYRIAASYDHATYDPPKLHIEYTAGGVTARTSAETDAGTETSLVAATLARGETATGTEDVEGRNLAITEYGTSTDLAVIPGVKSNVSNDGGRGDDVLEALIGTSRASDMKLPGRQGQVNIPSRGVSL
jgi:hypothetical protein